MLSERIPQNKHYFFALFFYGLGKKYPMCHKKQLQRGQDIVKHLTIMSYKIVYEDRFLQKLTCLYYIHQDSKTYATKSFWCTMLY
jgi:hypothetical protein